MQQLSKPLFCIILMSYFDYKLNDIALYTGWLKGNVEIFIIIEKSSPCQINARVKMLVVTF